MPYRRIRAWIQYVARKLHRNEPKKVVPGFSTTYKHSKALNQDQGCSDGGRGD